MNSSSPPRVLLRRLFFERQAESVPIAALTSPEKSAAYDLLIAGMAERRERAIVLTQKGRVEAMRQERRA